jgi:PIN domain nuclease of toxin-antitoxin system
MKFLLDTHILVWWFERSPKLTTRQQEILNQASGDSPLLVSDITLWEIATLFSLGRLTFALPMEEWLDKATAAPLVEKCRITSDVARRVANLPDTFHRDPADRIIVSTACSLGATLVTADKKIIDSNLVKTI